MNTLIQSLLLLAGATFATSACGAAQPYPQTSDPLEIARLYPLRMGSVWTYDVDTGEGVPTLAITRVTGSDGNRAEVSSGSTPIVYETRPDGLFRPDREAYVLKAPIRQGATWDAGAGSQAEVLSVDKQVSTPAGDFTHCVEVRESGGGAGKLVRTVFCPDIGPVEVESSMAMQLSGQTARVLAKLRGYDFSGILTQPAP